MHTLHNYIYVFSILCYNRKVNNVDLKQIKAVAFDIDGTLYRAWKFNLRIAPYFLAHSMKVVPRKALFVLFYLDEKGFFYWPSARSSRREKT